MKYAKRRPTPREPITFDTLMSSWAESTSKKIGAAIRLHGPEGFEKAKKYFGDVEFWLIKDQQGWERMCASGGIHAQTIEALWSARAKHYLEQIKYPAVAKSSCFLEA